MDASSRCSSISSLFVGVGMGLRINQSHLFRRRIFFNLHKEMRKALRSLAASGVGG